MPTTRTRLRPRPYRFVEAAARVGAAVACAVVLLPQAAAASVSDLVAFLQRAERMTTFSKPARADIRITKGGALVDTAVLFIDPTAGRQFVALKSSGWRALMPLDWASGKAVNDGGTAAAFGADDPIPGTDLRADDFFTLWRTDYATAFISDSTRMEKTVSLYARKELPYVLFVITFDKEKLVPLTIKYYRENMNNLVRLRRDSEFVMVGSRPRPRKIEIQDFTENSKTVAEIAWHALESVPTGFTDEASFHKTAVEWPPEPVAAR
jgi:hypothetical protein